MYGLNFYESDVNWAGTSPGFFLLCSVLVSISNIFELVLLLMKRKLFLNSVIENYKSIDNCQRATFE